MMRLVALFLQFLVARARDYRIGYFPFSGIIDYSTTIDFMNQHLAANGFAGDRILNAEPILTPDFSFFEYDFLFAFPSIKICMDIYRGPQVPYYSIVDKVGYEYQPLASMTYPYPAGFNNMTNTGIDTGCGLILVHQNSTIQTGRDIANRAEELIFQYGHPLQEGSGILQFYHFLNNYQMDIFLRHKMLRFNGPSVASIVENLIKNETDVGFIQSEYFFSLLNLPAETRAKLRIIDGKDDPNYPFTCSTAQSPAMYLFANPAVPVVFRQAVQIAALSLPAGGPQARAAGFHRFTPPLSSTILFEAMERARIFLRIGALSTCPPPSGPYLYDFLQCPANGPNGEEVYKLSQTANYEACKQQGGVCGDPEYECYCSPCRVLPSDRYLVRATQSAFSAYRFNATYAQQLRNKTGLYESSSDVSVCSKLSTCRVVEKGANLTVVVNDLLPGSSSNLPETLYCEIGLGIGTGSSTFDNMTKSDNGTWFYTLSTDTLGPLPIQIRVNGRDVPVSPFIINVVPEPCPIGYSPRAGGVCEKDDDGGVARATVLGLAIGIPVGVVVLVVVILALVYVVFVRFEGRRWFIEASTITLEASGVRGRGLVGVMTGGVSVHLHPVKRQTAPSKKRKGTFLRLTGAGDAERADSTYMVQSTNGAPKDPLSQALSSPTAASQATVAPATTKQQISDIIAYCKHARHPCLAYLYGYTYWSGLPSAPAELCLVEEYSPYGTLQDILDNRAIILDVTEKSRIAHDIACALFFLHSLKSPLVHGNINPGAILVNEKLNVKLAWRGSDSIKLIGASTATTPTNSKIDPSKKGVSPTTGAIYSNAPTASEEGTMSSSSGSSGGATMERLVEKSVDRDIEDFGLLLLQMYYPTTYESMRAMREQNVQAFDQQLRSSTDVPVKTQSIILDCLEKNVACRPPFVEIVGDLARIVEQQLAKSVRKPIAENDLYDRLFPKKIARAMKEGQAVAPELYDNVTLLFTDVCEFTNISSMLDPRDVQSTLDNMFKAFDAACTTLGCFRIEIIGDAYIAACGVDGAVEDHTARIAQLALKFLELKQKFQFVDSRTGSSFPINMRLGVHSGSVVGTVLGNDRPRFTVIGDAVNYTSRLETTSLKNRIQLSDIAAGNLEKQSPALATQLEERGEVEIKGKGKMRTFWLNDTPLAL